MPEKKVGVQIYFEKKVKNFRIRRIFSPDLYLFLFTY